MQRVRDDGIPKAGVARARAGWFAPALLLLLVMTWSDAYHTLFGYFSPYDDEGFMMLTVKLFVAGRPLYDELMSFYGPLYYGLEYAVHGVLGIGLSNNNVRFLSAGLWIATAALAAAAAHRLTRRASLAVLVYALTFHYLDTIRHEPGHPQELCGLLLALGVATAAWADPARPALLAVGAGAVAAGLVLTKINIGVLATLALLLAFLMAAGNSRTARVARAATVAAALLLPVLLLRPRLATAWGMSFALIVELALVALLVTARPADRVPVAPRFGAFFASALAVAALLVAFVLARRTTLPGLIQGLVVAPARLSTSFITPANTRVDGVAVALLALALAMTHARRWQWRGRVVPPGAGRFPALRWLGRVAQPGDGRYFALLKLLFSAGVFASVLVKVPRLLMNQGTPFLWLVLTPTPGSAAAPGPGLSRLILGFVATLQLLQAYPAAGSQRYFGTFLDILVAAVCLGDVLAWADLRAGDRPLGAAVRRAGLPLALAAVVALLAYRNYHSLKAYHNQTPIDVPGGDRLRLPPQQAALIRWLVANLGRHADTFLCTTGFNSLYLWAGKQPPSTILIGNSLEIYSQEQQEALIASLARCPYAWVITHATFFDYAGSARPPNPSALLAYIDAEYVSCGRVAGYEILVRRGREQPLLVDCARRTRVGEAVLVLSPTPGVSVDRVCLYDVARRVTIAECRPAGPGARWTVLDEGGTRAPDADRGAGVIASSSPRRLVLSWAAPVALVPDHRLIARLLDRQGRLIRSVPFLERPSRQDPSLRQPSDAGTHGDRGGGTIPEETPTRWGPSPGPSASNRPASDRPPRPRGAPPRART